MQERKRKSLIKLSFLIFDPRVEQAGNPELKMEVLKIEKK